MRQTERIGIERLPASPETPPGVRVSIDGRDTGVEVAGAVLEAAIEAGGRFLLFLTDDVPFEESLNIHLLDRDGDLLDSARLGGIYATGSFSGLRMEGPDRVWFRFIGDTDWAVRLLADAETRIPLIGDPRGVSRPFGFSRHFRIEGDPKPERTG